MGSIARVRVIGILGVSGLCLLFFRLQPRAPVNTVALPTAPPPRSAAEGALRRAAQYRTRAKIAVSEQRSGLEAWDPQASAAMDAESWRLQQLAFDRDGNLRQAQGWAQQAALLARTSEEAYLAAELQVLLDHEMGHHEAEFREAERLIALAPGSPRAQMALRRAQSCHRERGGRDGAPPHPSICTVVSSHR